jgi:hypothetical protein
LRKKKKLIRKQQRKRELLIGYNSTMKNENFSVNVFFYREKFIEYDFPSRNGGGHITSLVLIFRF